MQQEEPKPDASEGPMKRQAAYLITLLLALAPIAPLFAAAAA
ncbi:MAG: hypothetical protein AB7H66_11355 [Hyphomonadaceae bacterium]